MVLMSSQRPSAASPVRAGAGPTLMALAVLIGLMAMHGLAPGTATPYAPSGTEHAMASAAATGAQPDVEHAHPGQGGHAEHADAECAAGGVASAPPLSPRHSPSCRPAPRARRSRAPSWTSPAGDGPRHP